MSCPNCGQVLKEMQFDNQAILHCQNCGGTFFEENGINRITLKTAEALSSDRLTNEISGSQKYCPKDHTLLAPLQNDQSIPADVTMLTCSACHGIFVYPDDLLQFKNAQVAKVNYFKAWRLPLPSLQAVFILSVVAFVGVSFFSLIFFQKQNLTGSQAQDVVKQVYITHSGRYAFISFTTATAVLSGITFIDKTIDAANYQVVSDRPKTVHTLTTTNLKPKDNLYYQIQLTDGKGNTIETEVKKLILP